MFKKPGPLAWPLRILIMALSLCPPALAAEQALSSPAPDADWVEIEGPHIDYEDFVASNALLASPELANQERALAGIESAIREGRTSQRDQNLVNLLSRTSLSPLLTRDAPGVPSQPDQPAQRARAIDLLAVLGGPLARQVLLDIVGLEPDPAVLSEAYRALRRTRTPPDAKLILYMTAHLGDPLPGRPNDGLLQQILSYLLEAQAQGAQIADRGLFEAILALHLNRHYLRATNELALKTLKALMGLE